MQSYLLLDDNAARLWQGETLSAMDISLADNAWPKDSRSFVTFIVPATAIQRQIDTLPKLHGKSRHLVLQRLFERHFPETPWRQTGKLGYRENAVGGTEESCCFAAAVLGEKEGGFIQKIKQAGLPFAGISCLAAAFPAAFANYFSENTPKILILFLRQVPLSFLPNPQGSEVGEYVFYKGQLILAREQSLPPEREDEKLLADFLRQEKTKLLRHLQNQPLPAGTDLSEEAASILVLCLPPFTQNAHSLKLFDDWEEKLLRHQDGVLAKKQRLMSKVATKNYQQWRFFEVFQAASVLLLLLAVALALFWQLEKPALEAEKTRWQASRPPAPLLLKNQNKPLADWTKAALTEKLLFEKLSNAMARLTSPSFFVVDMSWVHRQGKFKETFLELKLTGDTDTMQNLKEALQKEGAKEISYREDTPPKGKADAAKGKLFILQCHWSGEGE